MSADTDTIVDPDTYVTGVPHEVFARLRAGAAVVWMEPAVDNWPAGAPVRLRSNFQNGVKRLPIRWP